MTEQVFISPTRNRVDVISPGAQGPAGRTILNGTGNPSNNLGLSGDFYYDKSSTRFYGPKLLDASWAGADNYLLQGNTTPGNYAFTTSWEIGSVTGPISNIYSKIIVHNLGFYPNVTIKDSGGSVLETGIDYNSINQITLTMAQPFAGTVYLS